MPEQSLVHALVAHGGHRCHALAVKWEARRMRRGEAREVRRGIRRIAGCLIAFSHQPGIGSLTSL